MWLKLPQRGTIPPEMKGHSACSIGDDMMVVGLSNDRLSLKLYRFESWVSELIFSRCKMSTFVWSEIVTVNMPHLREFFSLITIESGSLLLVGGRNLQDGTTN